MEVRKVTAKSQIVRDLTPGEVMIIASTEECRQLMLDLEWAEDAIDLEPASRKLWDLLVERMAL
jgi:hypothetical protein